MTEITHRADPDTRAMVQIVSAARLREILRDQGSDYSRPAHFAPEDEWDVGDDEGDA